MSDRDDAGVQLAGGKSATTHLFAALRAGVEGYPAVFDGVDFPDDARAFKANYPDLLPAFEAARADSDVRSEVARTIVNAAGAAMEMAPDGQPLTDAVIAPVDPPEFATWSPGGSSRLHPSVPIDGTPRDGDELVSLVQAMVDRGAASWPVAASVRSLVERAGTDGLDLSGRRIVMLGAGAELAPTRLWLAGGAEVLWLDLDDPPGDLLESSDWSGTLRWVPGGVDLLVEPARARHAIETFAGDERVDVGLYAYAPGRAREWRLTATMNAIVDALGPEVVRSVAMLVSPTTCGILTEDDRRLAAERASVRPRWQRAAATARLLGRGTGSVEHGDVAVNRGIVSIQGTSYQAAQYVGKLLTAEAWATAATPMAVSANTAGVSLTESLQHPVFELAFAGAAAFGVETFDPPLTAALNGLLTLADRLDADVAARPIAELFATRVHGGVYPLPYPIDPALRVAAAIGGAKHPSKVVAAVRR